jgi:hypothetical protein
VGRTLQGHQARGGVDRRPEGGRRAQPQVSVAQGGLYCAGVHTLVQQEVVETDGQRGAGAPSLESRLLKVGCNGLEFMNSFIRLAGTVYIHRI